MQIVKLFISLTRLAVAGFAPYEKRTTEFLKVGKDKRALKIAKRGSWVPTKELRGRGRRCLVFSAK
ncbi:unnamed protein product [Brassica oleracea var. botrytis]